MEVLMVPELHRLEACSLKGKATLVLTDTHLTLEPDAEFRAEVEGALDKGREGAEKAPGVIGWIAEKAVNLATRAVEKYFQPHPLTDVELLLKHDRVDIKLGRLNMGSDLMVDPTEAYIFDAKFRDAREALLKK
jgi:hypothetical protein